jgi:hypothetical protein
MSSAAERFTERMDALAGALREAGVDDERVVGLLGAAAEATMHAITLDALLDEHTSPRRAAQPQPTEARTPEPVAETSIDIAA